MQTRVRHIAQFHHPGHHYGHHPGDPDGCYGQVFPLELPLQICACDDPGGSHDNRGIIITIITTITIISGGPLIPWLPGQPWRASSRACRLLASHNSPPAAHAGGHSS